MQPFQVHLPTRIVFGEGRLPEVGELATPLGGKALIVIGGGSVERAGYLQTVTTSLDAAGIATVLFQGIEPNPHHDTVNRAGRLAREEGVDFVIALGGGSVMDAAKGIAAMALKAEGENDVWDYVLGGTKRETLTEALPVFAIPTTAATASEVTPYAVISNVDLPGKSPLAHECLKPAVALMDPTLTYSVSPTTTADGGADIISHVIENYLLGGNDSPIADAHSEAVMRTVIENLPKVLKDGENAKARANLFWASTLALSGLQTAGRQPALFVLHAIEHAMSAYQPDLAHGRGLATLFGPYCRWLLSQGRALDRMEKLGRVLFGVQDAESFIECFESFLGKNGLRQSVTDCGLAEETWADIAAYASTVYGVDGELQALGTLSEADIVEIFRISEAAKAAV